MKKVWLFSFNFLMYGGFAFIAPFIVLYYQKLNFSGVQIGVLTGLAPLIFLIGAPSFTGLADFTGKHRLVMSFCLIMVSIVLVLLSGATTFTIVLLLILTFNLFFSPVVSFVDNATMYMLGEQREQYGRIRVGGTLGWAIAATIAGSVMESHGFTATFRIGALSLFMVFLIGLQLNHGPSERSSASPSAWQGVRQLLLSPFWIRFLAFAFVSGITFSVGNNYLLPYMEELGAKESLMGLTLTIGTVVEIPALFFGDRLLKYLNAYRLLMLALFITGLRLFLFGIVGTPTLVIIIQALSGSAFALMWLAGVAYAHKHAPQGLSTTAQGFFGATVMGFGSAAGGMMGGLLLESMSAQDMFLLVGIFALSSQLIINVVWQLTMSKRLAHQPTGLS